MNEVLKIQFVIDSALSKFFVYFFVLTGEYRDLPAGSGCGVLVRDKLTG